MNKLNNALVRSTMICSLSSETKIHTRSLPAFVDNHPMESNVDDRQLPRVCCAMTQQCGSRTRKKQQKETKRCVALPSIPSCPLPTRTKMHKACMIEERKKKYRLVERECLWCECVCESEREQRGNISISKRQEGAREPLIPSPLSFVHHPMFSPYPLKTSPKEPLPTKRGVSNINIFRSLSLFYSFRGSLQSRMCCTDALEFNIIIFWIQLTGDALKVGSDPGQEIEVIVIEFEAEWWQRFQSEE